MIGDIQAVLSSLLNKNPAQFESVTRTISSTVHSQYPFIAEATGDERSMRRYDSRKEVASVFATDLLNRNHILTARNNNQNSKTFRRGREEETAATACTPIHVARIQPRQQKTRRQPLSSHLYIANLVRFFVVVAVVAVESGKMMATARKNFSRASMGIGKQSIRWSQLHCYFPGPLIVSASTVPSTVSRFHHNRGGPSESITVLSASRLFDIERYRGGAQHHFRQQRGTSSNHNYNRQENDRKDEKDHEATTENNSNNDGNTNNNPLSSFLKSQHRASKVVRQGIGGMFSLGGFLASSFVSFATDRRSFEDRFGEPIRALSNFLKTSGYVEYCTEGVWYCVACYRMV
jgi:hypothetical protein